MNDPRISGWQRAFRERCKARRICQRCKAVIGANGTETLCGGCRKYLALQVRIRYHVRRAIKRLEKEAAA